MKCPECGSQHVVKAGYKITVHQGRKAKVQCQNCGRTFYPGARKKKVTK